MRYNHLASALTFLPDVLMKAYSADLRQKIIDTHTNEKISQRQLAKRFRVTLSFVEKLLKQYRQTGEIAPNHMRADEPSNLVQST